MIRMKCYDGKEILMNRFNVDYLYNSPLGNYDTLVSELDLLGKYKINDLVSYGISGPTSFEHAIGTDAISIYKTYTQDNPFTIQLTKNYALQIYVEKRDRESYFDYVTYTQIINTSNNNILKGSGCTCQWADKAGLLSYLTFAITNVTFSDLPRFIISVDSDNITQINTLTVGHIIQDFNNLGEWGNINYFVANTRINREDSQDNRFFIDELRQNSAISEPVTPNVPDIYGNYDNSSDNIDLPAIEDINIMSSIASDLVKAYQIDLANLNQLTSFLWSDGFIDTIKKLQNNPMENIQKLFYLPYDVEVSASETVKIGNTDSNIQGNRITKQFQEIDFGNIDITEYYGNTLDYNTELSIYLPFIGEKTLNIYDIMGGSLNLKYRVDILTGNCIAILSVVRKQNDVTLNSVLYTYIGDMSNSVPLTSTQNNFFKQILGNLTNPTALVTNSGVQFTLSGVSGVNATTYTHSGNIGGNNGFMSVLTPYLIIRRPVNVKPADYEKTFGYPACTSDTLANQTGYCRYRECYYDNQYFDLEKDVADEILNKLKTKGIYIK